MQKRYAMSNMGYAIVFVIVLGIIMIISTPMIIDNYKVENKDKRQNVYENPNNAQEQLREKRYGDDSYSNDNDMINLTNKVSNMERRFDSRLRALEMHQDELLENSNSARERVKNPQEDVSDKFVCSIEGNLDSDGNLIPIDSKSSAQINRREKIVFVCDYKE